MPAPLRDRALAARGPSQPYASELQQVVRDMRAICIGHIRKEDDELFVRA